MRTPGSSSWRLLGDAPTAAFQRNRMLACTLYACRFQAVSQFSVTGTMDCPRATCRPSRTLCEAAGRPTAHPTPPAIRPSGRVRYRLLRRLERRWQAQAIQPPGTQAITMLSAEKEAHRRRVLEHLTHMAASGQRSAAPTDADPQFSIRLIGEVRRNDAEPRPPRRHRRRGEDASQPDLRGI